jgi:phenylpropionate dioxygenase-like ring-hydroxylating dioxygenase large terminal subunit
MNCINKQTPSTGTTYQQYLDREQVPVPEHLRVTSSPDLGDMHLDPTRYTSREMHDQEIAHVWSKTWQFACREEDIPDVGDYILYEVGDISLIVMRSAESEIKAFFNSCLHRGRKLVTEDGCSEKFRCPYHAWTWNPDGSPAFIPCKNDFDYAQESDFQLPEASVGTWQGFVFVNPDVDAKPLMDYLEVLPDHFKRYDLQDCYKVLHVQKVIQCNWKAAMEAFMESYHVIATHPNILNFMGDCNAQYDILGDHISRAITANAVSSPHLPPQPEQTVLEETLKGSGRVFAEGEITVPEGVTARRFLADMNREQFSEAYGRDFTEVTDSELLDAILYLVFPNTQIWGGFLGNIVYRSRPHGHNPDECLYEVMVLQRAPKGEAKPRGVKPHLLSPDETFSDAEELGVLGGVFDEDMNNLPHMQQGMKVAALNGRGGLMLGNYQESRIKHLHQMIDKYIAAGKAT